LRTQELLDIISPDYDTIHDYIREYGNCDGRNGIENILTPWAKNKGMLWNLLGKQLIKEIPISLEQDDDLLLSNFAELYSFDRDTGSVDWFDQQKNPFVKEYIEFITNLKLDDNIQFNLVFSMLNCKTFIKDRLELNFPHGQKRIVIGSNTKPEKLIIASGMKPMRALNKVVSFYGKENFPHFDQFRLDHSNILTSKQTSGTLVLSIHPLDYITMSDNANGWWTCMSWKEKGCYKTGTLEMMNSNNVICCYLKSKKNYEFAEGKIWNNKSWRMLVIVNKDIILSGKPYPYYNQNLVKVVINEVRKLAKENLNWNYRYGIQEYKDMLTVFGLNDFENRIDKNKKSILVTTNFMYNDIMEDEDYTPYWCVRNKPKRQKIISYSGKVFCLDCGKPFRFKGGMDGSEDIICEECYTLYTCQSCGNYIYENEHLYHVKNQVFCADCYESQMKVCPDCNELSYGEEMYIIFPNQKGLEKAQKMVKERYWYYPFELAKESDASAVYTCPECFDRMIEAKQLLKISGSNIWYLKDFYPQNIDYVLVRKKENWRAAPLKIPKIYLTPSWVTLVNAPEVIFDFTNTSIS
jgi:hypothetical protein